MNLSMQCINTIRILAADMVEKANSGHPGAPIGLAPVAHILWSKHLIFNPTNPTWPNRDRFILSNGHSCALQYCMLHLTGYDLTLEDLKKFRQLNSRTPGHPEIGVTPGIECTTGPLGQGIANAVGMAIGAKHASSLFNKPNFDVFDHKIIVICGDGCLQEGVSSEAISLAGHLKLDNLIVLYDDNGITIDGQTNVSFSENVPMRFRSYGWNTLIVSDANEDLDSINSALQLARNAKGKPTLISCKTIIGYKTLRENTSKVHGAPLGKNALAEFKNNLGFNSHENFKVSSEVYAHYKENSNRGIEIEKKWNTMLEEYFKQYPYLASEFKRIFILKELSYNWKCNLPQFNSKMKEAATRNTSGVVLNQIAPLLKELIGGSADLTPSNNTQLDSSHNFSEKTPDGRYIRFGVREHAMFSIGNGLSAYGFIPYTATFLNFITYGWGAVRLSALSHLQQIFVMTHDSVFLGEDGPTHQPIEVLPLIRATPNLLLIRPCDGNEVVGAWCLAIENRSGPTVIALSRQKLPNISQSSAKKLNKGAYRIFGESKSQIVLLATGSEVNICLTAAKKLILEGLKISVVSAPCLELFEEQSTQYKNYTLPSKATILSVEASSSLGWSKYAHHHLSIDRFGASGNLNQIRELFGFTSKKIYEKVKNII